MLKKFQSWIGVATVVGTAFIFFFWLDGKFDSINDRFRGLEKDIAVIKTVLIVKEMMPQELAAKERK